MHYACFMPLIIWISNRNNCFIAAAAFAADWSFAPAWSLFAAAWSPTSGVI